MSDIEKYSIEELEKALKRKKTRAKLEPLSNPDFTDLEKVVIEGVEKEINGEEEKDFEHWIYEAALVAVYGDDVFEKLRALN